MDGSLTIENHGRMIQEPLFTWCVFAGNKILQNFYKTVV